MTKVEIKDVIFVGHSKGTYEGVNFNTVTVSNGIEKIKMKNTVDSEILNGFKPEESRVNLTCSLKGIKESPALTLVKIEPAK